MTGRRGVLVAEMPDGARAHSALFDKPRGRVSGGVPALTRLATTVPAARSALKRRTTPAGYPQGITPTPGSARVEQHRRLNDNPVSHPRSTATWVRPYWAKPRLQHRWGDPCS